MNPKHKAKKKEIYDITVFHSENANVNTPEIDKLVSGGWKLLNVVYDDAYFHFYFIRVTKKN